MTKFEAVKERLVQVDFAGQFYDEPQKKIGIVLHHTAGASALSSIAGWKQDAVKVGTCVVIDRDGKILQCFPSDRWAYSLGINAANYKTIEKQTIAIEIANYGGLTKRGNDYYTAYNELIAHEKVCDLGHIFKGKQYYELYTDAQIESVKRLLELWHERYGIDISYKGQEIFALNIDALAAKGGVYTHNSYRSDKSDISPQPKIIEMLQSL